MSWILVFAGMFVLDFVWGRYTTAMAHGGALAAANWCVPITVLSGFVTISYVNDPRMLVPAVVGGWLGTFASKR